MSEKKESGIEARHIEEAARLQEIDPFVLFEEAFEAWFGKEPGRELIEAHHEKFLADEVAPFWVRSYVKKLLNEGDCCGPPPVIGKISLICLIVPILVLLVLITFLL